MKPSLIYPTIEIATLSTIITLCFSQAEIAPLYSQDWAKSNIRELQRADLRDLGYPFVNEIPENSSAITSLVTAWNGKIYGGTTGDEAYLFMFDPVINKVRHLGKITGQESIHHSIVEGKDSCIYFGTGMNMFEEITLSKGDLDTELDRILWQDIKNHFKDYQGGHLFRYNPKMSNNKVKLQQMSCDMEDLGIPLPQNSIYALTANPQKDEIYGLTYPDGHFFIYSLDAKKFSDLGSVDDRIDFHGPERYWRSLPRALICDKSGRVFMSGTGGLIRYYCPIAKRIITTEVKVPGDYFYIQFYSDYSVVDYFAKDKSGLIYGGTCDGYLFSLATDSMKLTNLGKVRASRRLRCLTVGNDGKVYLMAGERSATRPCQFYCYDPRKGGFEDLGMLIVDRSPYYYWRGQQFDSMVTGKDGTLYLGESERRSHLFLYIP
jgi:hypothetical protein